MDYAIESFTPTNPGTDYPVKFGNLLAQLTIDSDKVDVAQPGYAFGQKRSTTSGLTLGYYGGTVNNAGTPAAIADGTLALSASTTNYIERTAAGVVSKNTSGFTAGQIPLATAVTSGSGITSLVDKRTYLPTNARLHFDGTTLTVHALTVTTQGLVGGAAANMADAAADDLVVGQQTSGHTGLTIATKNDATGGLFFSDGTSGDSLYRGYVQYSHNTDRMSFGTSAATCLWINEVGYLKASNNNTYQNIAGTYHEINSNVSNGTVLEVRSYGASGAQYGMAISTVNNQNDTTRYFLTAHAGGVTHHYMYTNGSTYNTTGTFGSISTREVKSNIRNARDERSANQLPRYLDDVRRVSMCKFDKFGKPQMGAIAEDVLEVFPSLAPMVSWSTEGDENGRPVMRELRAVAESVLYGPVLFAAVHDLADDFDALSARVATIEGRLQ